MNYFNSRYNYLQERSGVWSEVVRELQRRFDLGKAVLDAGSGYGGFITHVRAPGRFAIDSDAQARGHLPKDVTFHQSRLGEIATLFPKRSLSSVFSSNVLEHLPREEITSFLQGASEVLMPGGLLVILMPNYRRAFREFFDDFTHVTALSDIALGDWLRAEGFEVIYSHPGFLPYSMKQTRLPVKPLFVRAWLRSPWKPGGKQMLLVAKKPDRRKPSRPGQSKG